MPGRVLKATCIAAVVLAVCAGMASAKQSQVLHAMKIDATALMPTQFSIDGRHFQGAGVETVELAQGSYRLDPGSGLVMRCELTVTGAGTWDYASECDSFLAGRGSDTLRLVGFAVTVDPSPLSTPIFFTGMSLAPFAGPRQLRLLPTINPYFAQPGAGTVGACHFNLALDGTFTYPEELEGCLNGRGTRTLTYDGVPVNIDARQLSTTLFSFGQAVALVDQPTGVIQHYRLLPTFTTTHYSFFTPRGVAWPSLGLRVGLDGRIDYPASADGWVSGRGTDTLVIRGYPVQIDATATAPGTFEIPDAAGVGVLDRGVVHHLRLPPVTYIFGTRSHAEFTFSVREQDGGVELAAGAGPCVSGAGSAGLTVGCAPPPPPPPPATGRNVSPPTIEFAARVAGGTNYRCNPGTWEGLPRTRLFEYTWYRVGSITGWLDGVPRATPTAPVATGPTYVLPRADYGKRFYCEVSAISLAGRTPSAFSATTVLTGREETIGGLTVGGFYGDFRIRGIDVFQIVQARPGAQMFGSPGSPSQPSTGPFPALCGGGTPTSWLNCATPANPQRTSYSGVALDQRKTTTAIVYVDMNSALATDPSELEITLSASVGTRPLSGPRTQRDSLPPTSLTPWVTAAQRADRQWGLIFTIPDSWLASAALADQPLDLEASVSLAVGAGGGYLRECPLQGLVGGAAGCSANNRYRLDDVPVFDDLPELTVRSLPLLTAGQNVEDLTAPERVMRQAVKLWPGGERMTILPYRDSVDINPMALSTASEFCKPYGSDLRWCRQAHVMSALDGWWLRDVRNRSGYNLLLGVHRYAGEPGFSRPGTTLASVGQMPTMTVNDGLPQAAAHEFGHTLGFNHAGRTCGSNAGGQVGDPWPPDDGGRLQGIGFDRSAVRRFGVPEGIAYRALRDDDANPDFDLMSYCGTSARRWLSAYNWNRAFATLRAIDAARRTPRASAARKPTAATAQAGQALATGVIGPQGGRFARVIPAGPGSFTPEPDQASPLRVRALDARGNLLLEVAPDVQMLKDSDGVGTFVASIPAGADAVELRSGATTLDRRERSQPPTVRVTAPRRGTRVGARQRLTVRWVARDPDGGQLHATVEYSPDDRHWRPVRQGPSRGRASIPGRFLAAGSRARVRVTVDDGFNHAGAVSAVFRAAGMPPAPRIVLPAQDESPQTGQVLLQGAAVDDRGRRIPSRALTWFAGSKRLGRGERVTANLPPGRVKLRLTAQDRLGRVGAAARKLVVEPVALRLRALRVPDSVKARARAVPVSLATAAPATARAGGRTWSVGPRARTVRIPLPTRPRTGLLNVTLRLTAHGQALRQTLVILRRQRTLSGGR